MIGRNVYRFLFAAHASIKEKAACAAFLLGIHAEVLLRRSVRKFKMEVNETQVSFSRNE